MKRSSAAIVTLLLAGGLSGPLPALVPPPAAAATAVCGFTAGTAVSTPIPDQGTATSVVHTTAPDYNDPLVDLDVTLYISHPYVSDLRITLSSGGHTVVLASENGGSGDDFTDTRFDDGAAASISAGAAPFTGRFRPLQSLNAFDDLDMSGVWTLRVTDMSTGDTGTLVRWALVTRTQWCDDGDRDTVKDDYDLCAGVKGVPTHGCPVRTRTATILYRSAAKEFRGKVNCASASRCHTRQPVRIYKVRAGNDALVGRGFTNSTGNYAIPKASVSGRYYAVAPTVVEEGVAECRSARSTNLAV